jgi:hypothetical protein
MTAGSWAWSMSHAHMDTEASLLASPQSQSYNNRFRYLLLTKVSPPSFIITICIRTTHNKGITDCSTLVGNRFVLEFLICLLHKLFISNNYNYANATSSTLYSKQ